MKTGRSPENPWRRAMEADHGTHSVFCRENGWISLSRLAGVSGGAGYEDSVQNTGFSIQNEGGECPPLNRIRWRHEHRKSMMPHHGGEPQVAFRVCGEKGEDSIQNTGVSIQNNQPPRNLIPPATHCPEKSFCAAQNEANHGTHSVFCRENGWISLFRLAGVSGAAG